MKLTNVSDEPQLVEDSLLKTMDHFTIIIKKEGREARQYRPFARYCWREKKMVLSENESMYESVFISAGASGWDISEPGNYLIQLCLHRGNQDIVSNGLRLRVLPPNNRSEEVLAQDFFSDEVARVLGFDGSRFFEAANDTLQEIVAKCTDSKVAIHANVALGMAMLRPFKRLEYSEENGAAAPGAPRGRIEMSPLDDKFEGYLETALGETPEQTKLAAESLGHVDYRYYAEQLTNALLEAGNRKEAALNQRRLLDTMSVRRVRGRKIADQVLAEIADRLQEIERADTSPATGRNRPRR